jgi:subtilase family serine protease
MATEICSFCQRPSSFGRALGVSIEPPVAIPPSMRLRRPGDRAGSSRVFPKGSTHVASVGVALLMLCSSAGFVALSGAALPLAFHDIGSKTALDMHTLFLGKKLASNQPSPYCNFASYFGTTTPYILLCYTPADLKVAYNFPTNLNGSGQTIVIVDAFGYPEVQADLNTFDAMFGLPNTTIQIVCQGGVCPVFNPSDPDQVSWSNEIAEDVQTVHSLAPGAHIVLYVATTDDDLTLEQAVLSAVQQFPHSVISQSWGDPELDMLQGTCFDDTDNPAGDCSPGYVQQVLATGEQAYRLAAEEGTTVFASAGDWGADNSGLCYAFPAPCGFTSANPIYPSSSPWVTAVGGTMGDPYSYGTSIPNCGSASVCSVGLLKFLNTPSCQLDVLVPTPPVACTAVGYGAEQVWNEPQYDFATGGAPSLIFGTPWYQSGLGLSSRATPDVSADAAASGGGYMYSSSVASQAGWSEAIGTSFGSPEWASIAALTDQFAAQHHRGSIGFINPALYLIGWIPLLNHLAFHDITVGNNTASGSTVGFNAGPGWDDASGWGTPNVANLVPLLAALS